MCHKQIAARKIKFWKKIDILQQRMDAVPITRKQKLLLYKAGIIIYLALLEFEHCDITSVLCKRDP